MATDLYKKKTRWFCVTQWNTDLDYQALIDLGQIRYAAYGAEICPSTGKAHHQAFIYFHNLKGISNNICNSIAKMFKQKEHHIHVSVRPMLGNVRQNEAYCEKDQKGGLTKFGDEPAQGSRGDLSETKDAILAGEIDVDSIACADPMMYHQYGRTLDRLEEIAMRKKYRTEMTKGIWYWGGQGVGKSHKAFEGFTPETHFVKCLEEKWWCGYKQQETVILNEFRGSDMKFSKLLNLVDKWPTSVKWKCKTAVPFTSKTLIVTCIMSPEDCYAGVEQDGEAWGQFADRFTVVHVDGPNRRRIQVPTALCGTDVGTDVPWVGTDVGTEVTGNRMIGSATPTILLPPLLEQKCSVGIIGTTEPRKKKRKIVIPGKIQTRLL